MSSSPQSSPGDRGARPSVDARPESVSGLAGVWVIVRRELSAKFFTRAFVLGTLAFAALMLASPLLGGGGGSDQTVVGHTESSARSVASLDRVGGELLKTRSVASEAAGRTALADGEIDVLLLPDPDGGHRALVQDSMDPGAQALMSRVLADESVARTAMSKGVSAQELAQAQQQGALKVVPLEDGLDIGAVMLGLAFPVGAIAIVFLWAVPLATDVMQEKVSRVVEILLTSIRPWQLLAGKIFATTIIGITQVGLVAAAGYVGMRIAGRAPDLPAIDAVSITVGLVCLVLAITLSGSLMAGLAARAERQEDLNAVLQPAFAVSLLPLLAAVYGAFSFADSPWLDVASLAPGFNVYTLPVRMAVESVPMWQVVLSLVIGVLTTAGAFALAGRIYTGSVLRSGGRVSLRDSLQGQ